MDKKNFRLWAIYREMEVNKNLQLTMKAIAGLVVFVIFFCSLNPTNTMNVAFFISMFVIVLLFILDCYCMKKNKKCELEIYQLEIGALEHKKEVAKLMGRPMPDEELDYEIEKPTESIKLPVGYYAVMLMLDIIIKVVMIH